jgi:hypothetical protein
MIIINIRPGHTRRKLGKEFCEGLRFIDVLPPEQFARDAFDSKERERPSNGSRLYRGSGFFARAGYGKTTDNGSQCVGAEFHRVGIAILRFDVELNFKLLRGGF